MNGLDSETKRRGGRASAETTAICSQARQEGRQPESLSDMHCIQAGSVCFVHTEHRGPQLGQWSAADSIWGGGGGGL